MIVTSVIVLSYTLGHPMPDPIVRLFNFLAVIFYIVAGSVMCDLSIKMSSTEFSTHVIMIDPNYNFNILLILMSMSFLNALFYGIDIGLNFRRAMKTFNIA